MCCLLDDQWLHATESLHERQNYASAWYTSVQEVRCWNALWPVGGRVLDHWPWCHAILGRIVASKSGSSNCMGGITIGVILRQSSSHSMRIARKLLPCLISTFKSSHTSMSYFWIFSFITAQVQSRDLIRSGAPGSYNQRHLIQAGGLKSTWTSQEFLQDINKRDNLAVDV